MSVTVNGVPVISGAISMPRYGAWHARLAIDADAASEVTGACSIAVEGGATLTGTAYRVGDFEGRISAWIVGGAGKLPTVIAGKFYEAAPSRTVLGDIAREAGETVSATADQATLITLLPKWLRMSSAAGRAIATLAAHLGVTWRLLDDGSIWVGPETFPAFTADYDLIDMDPTCDRVTIADETLSLRPGMTLEGRHVDYVEHLISADGFRSEAWLV